MNSDKHWLAKWYTRIIGIFFILITFSLIHDYQQFGLRLETTHKIFHILLGIFIVWWLWNNEKWWTKFCLINGAFFLMIAFIGIFFPDLGGLDAFNIQDTILHSIVGISGFGIGLYTRKIFIE